MNPEPERSHPLFDEARAVLDTLPADDLALARAKRAVLDAPAKPKTSYVWALGAAAALALIVTAAWATLRTEPALTFAVDDVASTPGVWLATEDTTSALRFADASELVLAPQSDATVATTTPRGATVKLARGRVRARITHRDDTEWKLEAGPFRIRVIGTSFETAWNPDDAYFELVVSEGVVEVEGPTLESRRVRAGSEVRVWVRENRARTDESPSGRREASVPLPAVEPAASDDSTSDDSASDDSASDDSEHSETSPRSSATPSRRSTRTTPPTEAETSALSLARDGNYAEAAAAIRARGVDRVLRESTPSERLLLADAARYARDAELAARFYAEGPSEGQAGARAAFGSARVALDLSSDAEAAIRWFRTSLRRAPEGPLAREARGRLMQLLHSRGDPSAREVAREYLRLHPDGPESSVARRIVGP